MNLFINKIKNSKQARSYLAILFSIFIFLSCANSADPDRSDPDSIVNNFLISIVGQAIFANPSCGSGLIQINSEAIPAGTTIDVDFVQGLFNNVDVCILDATTTIDANGQAFLEFIVDYIVGTDSTGDFRIVLNATTPAGQIITQFAELVISGIGIIPPTPGDEFETFVIEIPAMGLPPDLLLVWGTQGIKEGTTMEFMFDAALGSVSPSPATVGADGTATVIYTPNAVEGINVITASITLVTPPEILALCPLVEPSVTITATIEILQTAAVMGP